MQNATRRLIVSNVEGVTVVRFVDSNILDALEISQIAAELDAIIDGLDSPRLIISFAHVQHLSSAALGMLITMNTRMKNRDGVVRLCAINDDLIEVFKITRLHKLFGIDETPRNSFERLRAVATRD